MTESKIREYIFWGTVLLNDGTEELLDLEEHGWADKERLANTVRFSLIPKDGAPKTLYGSDFVPIVVNIPKGAKPVFKTRVKNAVPVMSTGGRHPVSFRMYGIGYKLGNQEPMLWVLPTGAIEVGEDSKFADMLLNALTYDNPESRLVTEPNLVIEQ
jgi:hypothetical protein